ncbi:Endoribonuclease L-PSP/chorismate mutase-like protein [Catenaria anguillulae PL171]|uniref:Endoribonuclease L-PSP/chorismate mutase-like protein n=1 Tax=Catenaria anguillulae PL171 TaxID=765915 RepID=A0A1Y2I547_9FUNG|nr:Endoribonuclease L-PSP/chorismate mutase-like protein [Catenaria anguillulae PL171]
MSTPAASAPTHGPNGTGFVLQDRAAALAHYPHARRVNGMLYVSGTSSRRLDGTHRGVTENADGSLSLDIKEQTRGVIENIAAIIKESTGAGLESIVDMTVFLVDMKDFPGYNEVYNTFFDAATGPTRTTVAVKQLPNPKLLIEIKAIAACP